jgi:hypothetical protein
MVLEGMIIGIAGLKSKAEDRSNLKKRWSLAYQSYTAGYGLCEYLCCEEYDVRLEQTKGLKYKRADEGVDLVESFKRSLGVGSKNDVRRHR